MSYLTALLKILAGLLLIASAHAANTVPTDIQIPGTQPNEVANLEAPDKCANCHAGYNDTNTIGEPQHEPVTGWRGGAMGNAGRDAIFWATVAVSEQDFDGSGDLCIRCHSTGGWYGGRSTPTDGSGLAITDDEGVDCDACHSMANPDNTEHLGVMNSPFTANCSDDPVIPIGTCESTDEAYYGGGMLSLMDGGDKLGPYVETVARHGYAQSKFQRSVDYCGTCHDVSNPAVGDLAPNHGAQPTAPPVVASGVLGGPVEDKAAFNNPPYAYGVIERTFSEYKASAFPTTRVGDFNNLPTDLKAAGGSLDVTYQASIVAASEAQEHGGIAGDYADGTPRFFSCQSCHMRPVESAGADKNNAEVRKDLPSHDHTGGNYWFADITKYQDNKGTLIFGGGLTTEQITALGLGQKRAVGHLQQAASLQVSGDTLKVVNLTGHKLISGYPEGRRMWANIKWYDIDDVLLREDGAYGQIGVAISNPSGGADINVESIIDLDGTNTRIYEAHYAVTRDWAITIQALHGADFELKYDRFSGEVACTVGDFLLDDGDAAKKEACKGDYLDTFHFTLNNYVSMDNRIPPYGMSYDIAQKRNTLPVPAGQYNGGGSGSIYNYWDEISLNPPPNADHARIELLYQGTSWEYIQFLNLANKQQNDFLGQEGINMLDAWLNATTEMDPQKRKMVAPIVMAGVDWIAGAAINEPPSCSIDDPPDSIEIQTGDSVNYAGTATDNDGTIASFAWSFAGGSPASADVEDPGLVTYNEAGVYLTTFSAEDNLGASCSADSITVTVLEPNTFTIGGSVSGLAGSGLVLQNNGGNNLPVNADGSFAFTTALEDGTDYAVTVLTQPTGLNQVCSVSNGTGTLGGANVTNVEVSCVTSTYTVGGTVDGLAGSGLVLQNNAGDNLAVGSDGIFTFAASLTDGSTYAVIVLTQPTSPTQTCSVSNGSGTLAGANITDVSVTCSTSTFTIGGSVSGLAGAGLILRNNGGDDLAINADGGFTFITALADGTDYAVTILTQPTDLNQVCSVSNANGTLAGANVTNVEVTCVTSTYTVGGTVSGLVGSGLVLRNNAGDDLLVNADGSFTFATALDDGSAYAVTVLTQPTDPAQTCSVSSGSGTLAGANITDVSVTCSTSTFTIGGSVSGLAGTGLILQNNGEDDLAISMDGSFTFAKALEEGTDYAVTILTQPTDLNQVCSVSNGDGILAGANIANIEVTCVTSTYTIGGTVDGLAGSGLVLQNNGGDDLAIGEDGGFTFVTALEDGSDYVVTVLTEPSDLNQTCNVSNSNGTLAGSDITDISVTCVTDTFSIGGSVSGLFGTGLVLQNNGRDDLEINADGRFTFPATLYDGSTYDVSVLTQPDGPDEICSVSDGSGTVSGEDVGNVSVACVSEELIFEDSFEY